MGKESIYLVMDVFLMENELKVLPTDMENTHVVMVMMRLVMQEYIALVRDAKREKEWSYISMA